MALRGILPAGRTTAPQWLFCLACSVGGAIANDAASNGVTGRATFLLLYPAVIIAGYVGGRWPAGLSALLGTISVLWFQPEVLRMGDWAGYGSIVIFLLNCSLIAALSEALHRAREGGRASPLPLPAEMRGSTSYPPFLIWAGSFLALGVAIAINPEVAYHSQGRLPYVIFLPVMALAGYLGGLRPAAVVTVVAVGSVWLWHRHVGGVTGAPFYLLTFVYLFIGVVIGLLSEALMRERRRADAGATALQELPEAQARFEIMARTTPDTVWIWDIGRRQFDFVSEAVERVAGQLPGMVVALTPESIEAAFHPEDSARIHEVFRSLVKMERGRTVDFEIRLRHRDSSWRWVRSRAGVFAWSEEGRATKFFGLSEDVTERRRTAEQLESALKERSALLDAERAARDSAERANRLKDDFLAIASHELRTPLTAISGWAAILAEETDPETVRQAVEVISRNVRAQGRLIDDLLDMSRMMRGDFRIEPKPVAAKTVLEAALQAAEPQAQARRVQLVLADDAEGAFALADPQRLQQMLSNLIGNAIKFTPERGRVTVESAALEEEVIVRVRDNGQGIDPAFLPHVFDRFSQQDSKTSRKSGGLGLGLAIVQHLATLHGGSVEAASAGAGQGSVFTLRLPRWKDPASATTPPAAGAPGSDYSAEVPLDDLRLVVIDDDADTCEFVARVLGKRGAHVTTARSARAGLEAVLREQPGAVICDISMPEEDGYQFIAALRASGPFGQSVPCLALTALTRPEDRQQALSAGFNAHCSKPVEPGVLAKMIAKAVRRKLL